MTDERKEQILDYLEAFIGHVGSAQKAASTLEIAPATVSAVRNRSWEKISDAMWRKLASATGANRSDWQEVDTRAYKKLTALLEHAQVESAVVAVIGDAGCGKTKGIETYCKKHRNAYHISCNEFWNRKYFLAELLRKMGRDYSGMTVAEMMGEVVEQLRSREQPLIVFDEADKLTDQVLYFFITLYNQLEDHCGIALVATDHLKKRILKGLRLNRKGYKEIYSRVNRRFIELQSPSQRDVAGICVANGIEDKETIKRIWQECEADLRRVKHLGRAYRNTETSEAA